MAIGYIPIILLLIIALGNITISLKLHKIVRTSDASNILVLGIVTMVIFALKDLDSLPDQARKPVISLIENLRDEFSQ